MPALNFQKQFADKVERGEKRQTIRMPRKKPLKVGDKLCLYTGQQTKFCRKLGEVIIQEIFDLFIYSEEEIYFGDVVLIGIEKEQFAKDDGFDCADDMVEWFKHQYGLPFSGYVIRW